MSKENKLYEVIRKHPNENSKFDMSLANFKYSQGEKIGFGVFVKVYGSDEAANKAIEKYIKSKWIKEVGKVEKKVEEKVVEQKEEKIVEEKPKGRGKKK